jgi:hypothetical protein
MTQTGTATQTQGRKLADHLRMNFGVGTRTRRYRNGSDLHADMIDALQNATVYPGYYTGERNDLFTAAWGVMLAYSKHVTGYRIDGVLRQRITSMTPYQFAALLGDMQDADVQTTGDGERFFAQMR